MLKKLMDSEAGKAIAEQLKALDQRAQALWAADSAEHVLHYFESARPGDARPREAIEAARAWARGEIKCGAARKAALAAHAAAREAGDEAATAAARAAGHAAATAHVARHSAGAGLYAAKAAFISGGEKGLGREREWQLKRLPVG